MSSLNKVMLIGRLGKDPETRYMPSGDAVCNFSIATSESWKDKNTGEKKESTEWHNIVAFGKLAEIAKTYLHKGSLVFVEGRIKTEKWTDQNNVQRYTTKIHISELKMLGSKADSAGYTNFDDAENAMPKTTNIPADASGANQYTPPPQVESGLVDSDIPF